MATSPMTRLISASGRPELGLAQHSWLQGRSGVPVEEQNKEHSKVKLTMPALALGGEYSLGNASLTSMKSLATDVRGGIVPFSGHWIPEERPDFLTNELTKFFSD